MLQMVPKRRGPGCVIAIINAPSYYTAAATLKGAYRVLITTLQKCGFAPSKQLTLRAKLVVSVPPPDSDENLFR